MYVYEVEDGDGQSYVVVANDFADAIRAARAWWVQNDGDPETADPGSMKKVFGDRVLISVYARERMNASNGGLFWDVL